MAKKKTAAKETAIIKALRVQFPNDDYTNLCELAGKFRFAADALVVAVVRQKLSRTIIPGKSTEQFLAAEQIATAMVDVALAELSLSDLFL